ncbi:hypothetical protein [Propioniciclava tarda]|uniref:Uncharacterized protein n=1 Tax=Propioniciclava tarda TaxID=433330 RepID=A0A4Q9KNL8_PROTD|nr:hypothetical protein [Propioniciclava tarda]TBT96153.1 hypothetical protein ET996_00315 [Propioniciclava tarda]SMO32553.1 hypothetical protein SAMN06266982_10163 [Propioniciclava tarda]HOA89428.1 hypothetical protein [Propioniciclava tarda]HQA31919.1 hypothetical protein [Propioniciclava tarda]HQD61570.1 hypothetical protein [Propioniciclava tarda]
MTLHSRHSEQDAAAILVSSPSVLSKIAGYVHTDASAENVDWARVAELADRNILSSVDRAFLGICADIAGGANEDEARSFGARWDALDWQHQAIIAGVLTSSAQSKRTNERRLLGKTGFVDTYHESDREELNVVRVRLGADHPAVVNDALGRERVGYREGASANELWQRGRGVWRMQPDRVIASQLLLIAHAGVIRLVGTIDGVTIHGDRLAIIGSPLADHPLIGQSDPLDNGSQNPVAYGSLDADD